jgi:hypothetical protein
MGAPCSGGIFEDVGRRQREKRRVRPALAQPRNVYVTYVSPFAQILAHHQHALNRVDMAVDPDRLRGQLPRSDSKRLVPDWMAE